MWDGRTAFMYGPPGVECSVRPKVESLFWWGGLSKSIGDVGTENKEILCSRDGIEDAGARMIRAISVGVVKDTDLSTARRSITSAAGLFATIHLFDCICPYEVEDGGSIRDCGGVTKHVLKFVLIEL
jgi:hypothetical protein